MCSRSWFSWGTPVQTVVSNDNIDVESFIKNQVDEVNEYRKTHGVDPLTLDENLSQYSQEWANHLASTGNFSHRGNSPYGENLASGYPLSSLNPAHMWYSEVNNINYNNLEDSSFKMAQFIRIKMMDKKKNVALSGNSITESSIRHAFRLPPNVVVELSYESNGMQINCGMNEAGTAFLLPDGWSTMDFFAESERAPSPPATPMDISQSTVPLYVPIETDALVHQLEKFLFYEKIGDNKVCFTVISNHYAVSFNHGLHQNWNSNSAENQTSVTICSQAGQEFQTRVIMCNADVDIVVVHSEVPLVSVAPTVSFPRKLERYILLGYPNASSSYQALEGIFSSVQFDSNGRMRGSSGSQRGYSGGPIFNYKGELLGINVANESSTKFIGLTGQTTMDELFTEVNAAFPSLSVIVPVYHLAMEILNYQQ